MEAINKAIEKAIEEATEETVKETIHTLKPYLESLKEKLRGLKRERDEWLNRAKRLEAQLRDALRHAYHRGFAEGQKAKAQEIFDWPDGVVAWRKQELANAVITIVP